MFPFYWDLFESQCLVWWYVEIEFLYVFPYECVCVCVCLFYALLRISQHYRFISTSLIPALQQMTWGWGWVQMRAGKRESIGKMQMEAAGEWWNFFFFQNPSCILHSSTHTHTLHGCTNAQHWRSLHRCFTFTVRMYNQVNHLFSHHCLMWEEVLVSLCPLHCILVFLKLHCFYRVIVYEALTNLAQ